MPVLPSGLQLALWDNALIEHDDNWFNCPAGHFWYWIAAPEAGSPLFDVNGSVERMPTHAPAPKDREEAKKFVQVLEMAEDGTGTWRGEWLADFSELRTLSNDDKTAWNNWLNTPEVADYLDRIIARCSKLAEKAQSIPPSIGIFIPNEP